jgi:DNA-binding HxlR family transcriptional regulator
LAATIIVKVKCGQEKGLLETFQRQEKRGAFLPGHTFGVQRTSGKAFISKKAMLIMARTEEVCPTLSLVHIMGKRWTIPIMEAFESELDEVQFNELETELADITPKNLSGSLKELCAAGLLEKREVHERRMAHTSYTLTKKGTAFQKFIHHAKELGICIYGMDPSCANRKCIDCYAAKFHPVPQEVRS